MGGGVGGIQVFYSFAPVSLSNIKVRTEIISEISCTQGKFDNKRTSGRTDGETKQLQYARPAFSKLGITNKSDTRSTVN